MLEEKIIIGILAIILSIIGYIFYYKDIFAGKTKPHIYTWAIWSTMMFLVGLIQFQNNGGFGAYVTLSISVLCLISFFLAFKYGTKNITICDKTSGFLAIIALIFWIYLDFKLEAIILLIFIELLGFYPTFRKSINNPFEETPLTYGFMSFRSVLAILAISEITFLNSVFHILLVSLYGFFAIFLISRRNILVKKEAI